MGQPFGLAYLDEHMVGESRALAAGPGRRDGGASTAGPLSRSILIVTPEWPLPPTWGFAMRVYNLAKQLSARHRVSLLTYGRPNLASEPGASIFESVHSVVPPARAASKRRAQAASLLSTRSHHMSHLVSDEMASALEKILSRREFDLVQLESSQLGYCADVTRVPTVLDEHNIEFLLLRRLAGAESSPARRMFGYLEAAKAMPEEVRAWNRCNGSVFMSEADLHVMRARVPNKAACVVQNGVDVDYFSPVADEVDPDTIVFTGAINYRPNTDAVAYFIREVFPLLTRLRPSAKLVVVGQGAPDWLVRMQGRNVEFTGAVRDVRPYVARAAVVVAPLRAGSGTRLKILEALAMAKPVVTTTIGCEGLGVADGEHVLVADDPKIFAETTARLMSDPKLACELGRNGRVLAEQDYSWGVIAPRLEQFHSQLINKEIAV